MGDRPGSAPEAATWPPWARREAFGSSSLAALFLRYSVQRHREPHRLLARTAPRCAPVQRRRARPFRRSVCTGLAYECRAHLRCPAWTCRRSRGERRDLLPHQRHAAVRRSAVQTIRSDGTTRGAPTDNRQALIEGRRYPAEPAHLQVYRQPRTGAIREPHRPTIAVQRAAIGRNGGSARTTPNLPAATAPHVLVRSSAGKPQLQLTARRASLRPRAHHVS